MDTIPGWIFYIMAAVAGLELGGLATIFIQRWIDEQPIARPARSQCPSCEEKLGFFDTIPVVSYLLLKGRCRHCNAAIGVQYMLVELSCLAWALALAHRFGPTMEFGVFLVLGVMLIAGSFIDFETYLLPDRITLGGAAIALGTSLVLQEPGWVDSLRGAVVAVVLFGLIERVCALMKKQWLGLGDVKLMAMIGAMTGLSGLPVMIVLAAAVSYVALGFMALRKGMQIFGTFIPYGPFLSLGCMIQVLYGDQIMRWWNTL